MTMTHATRVRLDTEPMLDGDLVRPDHALGLVLFAHGSGSSRQSPRNRFVADRLHRAGLATLLVDLLTEDEDLADRVTGTWRFDIGLLAERLGGFLEWTTHDRDVASLPLHLFGASTGGGAALAAAAARPDRVASVVSRGGRPDLAGDALPRVRAPTLLIVGSLDRQILALNRQAAQRLVVEWRLEVVDGATHLFEEPGTLERVAELAGDWFTVHSATTAGRPSRGDGSLQPANVNRQVVSPSTSRASPVGVTTTVASGRSALGAAHGFRSARRDSPWPRARRSAARRRLIAGAVIGFGSSSPAVSASR
jgi:dienelactone hydrolase